jgi:hypothetical protein
MENVRLGDLERNEEKICETKGSDIKNSKCKEE